MCRKDDEEESGDDEACEKHLPGLQSPEGGLGCATGQADDPHIDEAGEEKTEDDGQLTEANQAASDVSRCNFCDVPGGNGGCCAKTNAADNAGEEKEGVSEAAQKRGDGAKECFEEKEGTNPHQGCFTPDLVGNASRSKCANKAADNTGCAGNALQEWAEVEGGADGFNCGVEDHSFESVEEGAQGCNECKESGVFPRPTLGFGQRNCRR